MAERKKKEKHDFKGYTNNDIFTFTMLFTFAVKKKLIKICA